jgi:hypothetical protein
MLYEHEILEALNGQLQALQGQPQPSSLKTKFGIAKLKRAIKAGHDAEAAGGSCRTGRRSDQTAHGVAITPEINIPPAETEANYYR